MYNLIPDEQEDKQPEPPSPNGSWSLMLFLALAAVAFYIFTNIPANMISPSRVSTPTTRPMTPTFAVKVYPTAVETVLRTAWIEARETCPNKFDYGEKVVPGANLWVGEGSTKTATGRNIRHSSRVKVLSESAAWIRIQQDDTTGYVQSFFIVDYDPSIELRPATGSRFDMLC